MTLDPTVYPFPLNLVAWVAVIAALLAGIFVIGAMVDGITELVIWRQARIDARRRNEARREWQDRHFHAHPTRPPVHHPDERNGTK